MGTKKKHHIKTLGGVLLSVGIGSIALAFLWDVLLGHPVSFGVKQALLILGGTGACLAGVLLVTSAGRLHLEALHSASLAYTPATHAALRKRPYVYLLYAVWLGAVFGLVEVSYPLGQKIFMQAVLFKSLNFVWMVPAFYALLFGMIGLGLSVLVWQWPERVSLRAGLFSFLVLGFSSVLFSFPKLHPLAVVVLATGLAAQGSRLIAKHAYLFHSSSGTRLPVRYC